MGDGWLGKRGRRQYLPKNGGYKLSPAVDRQLNRERRGAVQCPLSNPKEVGLVTGFDGIFARARPRRDTIPRMSVAPAPLLIAHRGESYDAPENTLAAVRLAWERGAAAVEIDARMSADGVLMVSHDPDTRRIGGPRRALRHQTATELQALDAGAWKHRRWAGERLPRLRDVLATLPPQGRLFVEMKEGPETVPPLVAELRGAGLDDRRIIVMSFLADTVAAAARDLGGCEICLLLRARDFVRKASFARAIDVARGIGCHSLDVEVHAKLDRHVINAAHAAGLAVYVWTVNRVATARRLTAAGIDGITTDRCAWLHAQLASSR